ncbi:MULTISPECIES: NAD(P)/FAD-dependent oxidoreductase [unclassified Shinella]|uniref:NAD(P)/FAD-dependent oxidoreductase n=1 Tax=unclassified Shinella TaxID=2643062 RepID=UPI00234F3E27|nr:MULTISPECIES: FAD-binding oxidoreductase [unclassified Shinella]MCO5154273.1 FAD-binding oxidoreductase [Shinella sp.]MDC7261635.1 FAD-binding oxidoreductase [Shinella sp. HY16]MDC7268530.1 FAD-binding oxidoreductase [Shinella sp. YZ44]
MRTFDIAIIGGGIAGLSLAYFLSPFRSVVVLEQEGALGYHSTGRSAAEFTLRDNAPLVNALARASHDFLMQPPEGFADVPLLIERGSIILGTAEKTALVRARFEAAKALGVAVEWLDEAAMLARAPMLDPAYAAAAYFDPDYWDIEVDALLQAYARHARRNGAQILEGQTFSGARRVAGAWRIETGGDTISAGTLVNAAGGWADAVAALSGVAPAGIVPHRRTAITVDLPGGIDASRLPEINEIEELFYFKPEGGRLLASPADATPCEPADVQPEELDIAYAAHYVEEVTTLSVRRVFKSWAGMRSFSADRLPVIGPAKDEPSFFWLAGQGGYGILTSPALGSLSAALLTGSSMPEPLAREGITAETFSPSRFS